MDFHDNHCYHPYAPPADARHEKYLGREWYRRDHSPFPIGHRGARNSRYIGARRGTGTPRLLDREEMYRSPRDHRLRPSQGYLDPRYEGPQQRPSPPWYQGQSNVPNAPSGSTNSNNLMAKATVSACSQQTNVSEVYKQTHCNLTSTSEPLSMDKQRTSADVKNPSVAKVVPFSHQPAPNNVKCSVGASTLSATLSSSTATNTQTKSDDQTVSQCNAQLIQVNIPSAQCRNVSEDSLMTIFAPAEDGQLRVCKAIKSEGQTVLSQVSIPSAQCLASEDGLTTVFAQAEDGQLRPICRTICSCQLRKRALKYAEKGKTKNDSIIIDSDGEEEKSDTTAETFNSQEKTVFSTFSVEDTCCKPSGVAEPSCQDTPRKRAKMSIENNPEERSLLGDNTASDLIETDISSSVTCTESVADTVARIVDGLRQSVGEGCSTSSTSSDSLSSLPFASVTVDAPLLANPQILQQLLDECNEISSPFKKLKISPRNLYTAAKECNVQKVLALLVGGCDPNQQVITAKGKTAMHAAAGGGYVDIMACLRLAGCDLNLVDYENRTPFFDAVNSHKVKAVEYLIECGANLGVKDRRGMTCFHLAVRQGHTDLIKLLLKTGQFDINEKDDGGWTPIMWAAEDKQYDATQLLIEQGANVHIRDLELNVPLHWAALSGNLEVCKLLLDQHTDINTVNKHVGTPLHIAARDNHYECVQLFVSRGAYLDIKNEDDNTPLEVAHPKSRSYSLLKAKRKLESCQEHIRPRILHSDISRGQENVSISCINEVDEEPFPDFTFVKECCEIKYGTINWSISKAEGCQCKRNCQSGESCLCSESSKRQRIWYNEEGVLTGDIQSFDRPLLYECNRMCNCWSYCKNRVVQKGMQFPLQLYRTLKKGWGVRGLAEIPEGSFVCEYTGELISDSEADARDDDSYLFDLDCKENSQDLFCIDAKNYGNISRFINHSCEPNIFPLRVFINHRDIRFPRIAFFASKEIKIHEEICFNYGDRFWSVKAKEFYCECETPSCKYRNPNSSS